jgi:hypothetical protein
MRAELRLAWVRDLPVVAVRAGDGDLLVPLRWAPRLPSRNRPHDEPDGQEGPRLPSGHEEPA